VGVGELFDKALRQILADSKPIRHILHRAWSALEHRQNILQRYLLPVGNLFLTNKRFLRNRTGEVFVGGKD